MYTQWNTVGEPLARTPLPEVTYLPFEAGWLQWDLATILLDKQNETDQDTRTEHGRQGLRNWRPTWQLQPID